MGALKFQHSIIFATSFSRVQDSGDFSESQEILGTEADPCNSVQLSLD